jgi:transposase
MQGGLAVSAMLFDNGPPEGGVSAGVSAGGGPHGGSSGEAAEPMGRPRLRVPHRDQVEFYHASLDQLLEPDHTARVVWEAVRQLDLSPWLCEIKAVEGHVGRNMTDPRMLLALWIYATLEGIGSARELARLCENHLAYKWLCGGVSVNHHMLSDFRSQNGAAWDDLLTHIVGTLTAEGLVTMVRVAQDGMRTRASAGKSSFRRKRSLEDCLAEARRQVETLKQLAEESSEELTNQQRAARERAAREREARIKAALENLQQLRQQRDQRAKKACEPAKEARASTTDPDARVMKAANGGYQPGYNVQFATDTASGVIVGVEAANAGNDSEQLAPMLDQLKDRYDTTPAEALVDGGFATKESIEQASERGCTVYAPLKDEKKQRAAGKDPCAAKRGDTPAVAAWRARMGTAEAKTIYRLRCQTAEWVNALARNRGLYQMPVRGQAKCRTIAVLYAIAHNVMQGVRLRAQRAAKLT